MKKVSILLLMLLCIFNISFAQMQEQNDLRHPNQRPKPEKSQARHNPNFKPKSGNIEITNLTLPVTNLAVEFSPETSSLGFIPGDDYVVCQYYSFTLNQTSVVNFSTNNAANNISNFYFDFFADNNFNDYLNCYINADAGGYLLLSAGTYYFIYDSYVYDYDSIPYTYEMNIAPVTSATITEIELDYSENVNLELIPGNPGWYNYGNAFYYSFTLDSPSFINIEETSGNLYCYVDNSYSIFSLNNGRILLSAGEHTLVMIDHNGYFDSNTSLNTTISISKTNSNITFKDITLNYSNDTVISDSDLSLNGKRFQFYKFTLNSTEVINFNCDISAELYTENFRPVISNGTLFILPAGTYYLIINDYGDFEYNGNINVDYSINITATPLNDIETIDVNSVIKGSWSIDNLFTIYYTPDYFVGNVFKLNKNSLPNPDDYPKLHIIDFSNVNYLINLVYFNNTYISEESEFYTTDFLYDDYILLFVGTEISNLEPNQTEINANIAICYTKNYDEINASQEITPNGESIYFSNEDLDKWIIAESNLFEYAKIFTFHADSSLYKLNINNLYTSPNLYNALEIFLLKENLTGNIASDFIGYYYMDFSTNNNGINLDKIIEIEEEGNYKLLLLFNSGSILPFYDVFANISMEKILPDTPNTGVFVWETMTLPFNKYLYFDHEHNVMVDTIDLGAGDTAIIYKRGFILTLEEETNIYFERGNNNNLYWYCMLYIYSDPEMTTLAGGITDDYDYINDIKEGYWEDNYFTLPAGTYYMVFNDDGYTYNDYNAGYYSVEILLTMQVPYIYQTITELLNSEDITVIEYSNNLSYSESDYWYILNTDDIVQGQDNDPQFRYIGHNYFAKAYKITDMQTGDNVKIHTAFEADAYAYIYRKTTNGYEIVASNDDDWSYNSTIDVFPDSSRDAYFNFDATNAEDYYLVATCYSSIASFSDRPYKRGVAIWTGDVDEQPDIDENPILIIDSIISTTASQSEIHFADAESNISDNDRRIALLSLSINANYASTTSGEIPNNPFFWTITANSATLDKLNEFDFHTTSNYNPAVVTFTYENSNFTVSGTVTDGTNPLANVVISYNGGTTTTLADGTYSFASPANTTHTVTPTLTGYSFDPATQTVNVAEANVTGIDFVGTMLGGFYTVSGTVTDGTNPLADVTITYNGGTTITDANGTYSFTSAANTTHTVTASKLGYSFTPASLTVNVAEADVTGQDFVGTAIATYTVSGTVKAIADDSPIEGVTITYNGGGINGTATTAADGTYSFVANENTTYTVVANKTGFAFSPATKTVNVAEANVTDVDFYGTVTYNVEGIVKDSESDNPIAGVTITYNGGSTTTASDGTFSFAANSNTTYTVTPSKAGYTFTPATKTVNVAEADVTGIIFYGASDGTPVDETEINAITVYPNPASDYIKVAGLTGNEQILVFDINGRVVKTLEANDNIETISINDLAQGSYMITVRKENKIEVLKFIK